MSDFKIQSVDSDPGYSIKPKVNNHYLTKLAISLIGAASIVSTGCITQPPKDSMSSSQEVFSSVETSSMGETSSSSINEYLSATAGMPLYIPESSSGEDKYESSGAVLSSYDFASSESDHESVTVSAPDTVIFLIPIIETAGSPIYVLPSSSSLNEDIDSSEEGDPI
jgi:hypothetical protein